MPQRLNQATHKSDEVQGEGSFVVLRRQTLGEETKHVALVRQGEVREAARSAILACVLDWNWVDDEGRPLPLPSKGLDLDLLTDDEVGFLVTKITGKKEPEQGKN